MALGFGAVWVTTANATYRTPSLLRVDPRTLRVRGQRGAGRLDVHVAAEREGLWTTGSTIDLDGHGVSPLQAHRIDPASGRVISRTRLGALQDGGLAVGAGAVWVSANRIKWRGLTAHATGTVWRLDPATGRVTARTRVPAGAGALLVSHGAAWVLSAGAPLVSRIDVHTAKVTPCPVSVSATAASAPRPVRVAERPRRHPRWPVRCVRCRGDRRRSGRGPAPPSGRGCRARTRRSRPGCWPPSRTATGSRSSA